MIAQNRLILKPIASWWVRKADRYGIIPSDGLKTDWVLIVVLANCSCKSIVEVL